MKRRVARLSLLVAGLAALLVACPSPAPEPEPPAADEGSAAPAAPAVSAVPEVEPNDAPEQAMRVRAGRPTAGSADGPDRDHLLIPGAEGTATLLVTTANPTRLQVARPQDGATLEVELPGGPDAVRVGPFTRASSLRVALEGAGAWTLDLETDDEPRCGFGFEPDERAAPGVTLTSVPSTVPGCLTTVDDVDIFRVTSDALSDVPGLALEITGVEGVAFLVELQTESGTTLTELAAGPGETVRLPNLAAPAHGDLYLSVASLRGANEAQPYTLELRRLPPLSGTIELEPNDDDVRATIVPRVGLINGYLHRPGDRDVYRLMVEETTVVRMLAQPPEGVDLQLEIPGGPLGTLTIDDGAEAEEERVCSMRLDSGDEGTVFAVTARSVGDANVEPYLMTFQLFDDEHWEVEPNDSNGELLERDTRLAPGERPTLGIWLDESRVASQVSGYTFPPGDVDRFVIEVFPDPRAAATYTSITVRLEPNGATDYALEIVDEDGAAVAMADNGTVGEVETVSLDLPAGRYVARVGWMRGETCDQPYRLSVLQTALPGSPEAVAAEQAEGSGEGAPVAPGRDRDGGDINNLDRTDTRVIERGMTREEAIRAQQEDAQQQQAPRVPGLPQAAPSERQPPRPTPRDRTPVLEPPAERGPIEPGF